MKNSAKITEIFKSIQGEGKYVGAPQVFVRFFECHMHCTWCDTPGSIGDTTHDYQEVELRQLVNDVTTLYPGCHSVSITGGEPLMQHEFLKEFLPLLRERQQKIYLETSGVLYKELSNVIDLVDIVSMDIKLPSSTKQPAFWKEHEEFIKIARAKDLFIKIVITRDTIDADVHQAVDLIRRIDPNILCIFQPNFLEMKQGVITKCQEYQEYAATHLKDTRVMIQAHKLMKLR